MLIKFTLKSLLFLIIILILPLTDALSQMNIIFSYLDEVYLLGALLIVLLKVKNNKIQLLRLEIYIILLFIIILTIGLLSSIIFKIQPINIAITELLMFSKFIVGYFLSRIIFSTYNLKNDSRKVIIIINTLTVMMFLLFIFDMFFNIFSTFEYRFGIRSYNLVFSHPTYLAGFGIIMISLYTFLGDEKIKGRKIYIFINLLLMISTLRNKAMIFVCLYLFVKPIYRYVKLVGVKIYLFLLSGIFLLLLFQNAISERLLSSNATRNVFYTVSLDIASNYFPFGAGLGTFASYISGKYYSPVYFEYGLNNTYGMTPTNYSYIADTFWPMVLAQFGIIGFVLFIILILNFIRIILKINNKYNKLSCIFIILYILVSSTSEAIFNTYVGIVLFMLLGVFISIDINDKKYINEGF